MRLHAPFLLIYSDADTFCATAEKVLTTKEAATLKIAPQILELLGEGPVAVDRLRVGADIRVRMVSKESDEPELDIPVTALGKVAVLLTVQGDSSDWLDAWLFTNMQHIKNYDRVIRQAEAYYVPVEFSGTDHSSVRFAALVKVYAPDGVLVLDPSGRTIGALSNRETA